MNRLAAEKSAYLRHSAYQKIDWYPWSDEAFEKALREDKPVFLSTGAIWCHWCHVMAKECFENEEIVRTLNEDFVCIKLDRDERPDIDKRYQQAVAAMGNGGGWPLSVFLGADRKPFFGGTYFPPEDGFGRPGFKKVLLSVADFYRSKRGEVSEYTARIAEYLRPGPSAGGEIGRSLVGDGIEAVMAEFDAQNGGFGSSPKFPMPGAITLLMNAFFFGRSEPVGMAVKKTLESMAKGGICDQLGGGFHRYSTDASWIIPHFEKMADDNSWLLRNYSDAYAVFGDELFRRVAQGIVYFARTALSDPDGGFYASQDADVTPDDEGGYFTWRDDDFRRVLDEEEYRLLSMHLLHERGSMHHDPAKKVLFSAMEPEEIAVRRDTDVKRVLKVLSDGKGKLLRERDRRQTPFIDRTLYTSLNGMFITAFFSAWRALGDDGLRTFALRSLEKILELRLVGEELFHSDGVRALIDDYVFIIEALIGAYEATGKAAYLDRADQLMERCLDKFWDPGSGGFFDAEEEVLGVRLKAVEDVPHPSANSVGVIQLLRLFNLTGKNDYYTRAGEALRVFAKDAAVIGLHAGYYFCSLDSYYRMTMLSVGATAEDELVETAIRTFSPYKCVRYSGEGDGITPCTGGVCLEPVRDPASLREVLLGRG